MLADVQSSYGLDRPFQGAGNFETEHQRTIIREVCAAVQTGRLVRPVRGCWTDVLICDSLNLNNGLRDAMGRRRIGQEKFGFAVDRGQHSSLDALAKLIDWVPIDQALSVISCSAKGEPAWPPMALFKAMLLSIWYDLSDVKLAEALDDRGSFRRFCGFSAQEPTPERTAFVRFRKVWPTVWTRRCSTRSPASSRPKRFR
ncbi:transposase [Sinorhizobium meliloti]|uniref:transposase n=2 Tax=Sinorhizobium/Ensifer group TaxID=227292 RepID=UPI0003DDD836|nr:transposase [Sinorhizobium meliloti]